MPNLTKHHHLGSVPVFVGFAFDEAPHVEPGGGVGFASGVFEVANRGDHDEVAFGDDSHHFCLPILWAGNGGFWHGGEEAH